MEKIDGNVWFWPAMVSKVDEIVKWINEQEKKKRHKLTVDDWKKLGGGEGPSQGGGA